MKSCLGTIVFLRCFFKCKMTFICKDIREVSSFLRALFANLNKLIADLYLFFQMFF